jgi:hypothetical protein
MIRTGSAPKEAHGISFKKMLSAAMIAAATPGLYLLLALRYPLAPSLDDPRASWASLVEPSEWNALWHLAIYLGLTLLYIATLRLWFRSQGENIAPSRYQIIMILAAWITSSVVLMAAAPAGESHDIFDYLFRGRMMTEYHANPLVDTPDEFDLSTPYTRYLAWRKNVDTYGPVWEASSAAVAVSVRQVTRWLGWWDETYPVCPKSHESCRLLTVYITCYRLLAVILTGLSGWLIFSMTRRNNPSLAGLALAAWLLSPMTLIATALGGHNDSVMLVLVLFCWWLLQRGRPSLALVALILAAHVKLTALIWLPACLVWVLWRWGWKAALKIMLISMLSGLVLSWLLYAPFGGWQSLPRMLHERSEFLANSLWRILNTRLINQWGLTAERAHQLSIGLPNWLFAIGSMLIPLRMFNFRPRRWQGDSINPETTDQKLWQALLVVSLYYLLVGSFWFQPWYVLWVMAPAALLPSSSLTRSVLPWLMFGALSSNMAMDFLLNSVTKPLWTILNDVLGVVIIWGPALLAASVLALTRLIKRVRPRSTLPSMKLADH